MKEGPDIALLGSLIGDPARANMLVALLSGKALTASELAHEASITLQTASSHLKKLEEANLLALRKQGRHRYFALADEDVGALLESMMGLAAKRGMLRTRTGPKDADLRHARICYNHLAGDMGIRLFDSMIDQALLVEEEEVVELTDQGEAFILELGLDLAALKKQRRPLCKGCLDWSNRRTHLAGSLGQALLEHFYAQKWARREEGTRIIHFNDTGTKAFHTLFPMPSDNKAEF
jgi:DNA-binding transcriptional ArsR family regulator